MRPLAFWPLLPSGVLASLILPLALFHPAMSRPQGRQEWRVRTNSLSSMAQKLFPPKRIVLIGFLQNALTTSRLSVSGCIFLCLSPKPYEAHHHQITRMSVSAVPKSTPSFVSSRRRNPGQIKTEYKGLDETDFGMYPLLEEVKVHLIRWPTTEREIDKGYKSLWVKWAERLMNLQVTLTNGEGQHWIPRLK